MAATVAPPEVVLGQVGRPAGVPLLDVVGLERAAAGAAGEAAALAVEGADQLPQRQARQPLLAAGVVRGQVLPAQRHQAEHAAPARQGPEHRAQRARRQQLPVTQPAPAGQRVDLSGQRRPGPPDRRRWPGLEPGAGQLQQRVGQRDRRSRLAHVRLGHVELGHVERHGSHVSSRVAGTRGRGIAGVSVPP